MGIDQTITPKSDQLNYDDMTNGPKTIKVTGVKVTGTGEDQQPVAISYEGDTGKPYKPCKSMRRVLVNLWGGDEKRYVGRSMTLYGDPLIKFGSDAVGGIRISHMSHIQSDMSLPLTMSKGKRKPFSVKKLEVSQSVDQKTIDEFEALLIKADPDTAKKARDYINKNDGQSGYEKIISRLKDTTTANNPASSNQPTEAEARILNAQVARES